MALSDTGGAIASVSELLQTHLQSVANNVTIGRPEEMASTSMPTLNLFLYEIQFDQGLRQVALDEGQPVPLWLVLKYLLTAFDGAAGSDTIAAQRLLGRGMQALYELSLTSIKKVVIGLQGNPEELKLKFDDTPSDLLSKIMQGSDEKYRCSVSFEVRPVMIATSAASSYSLLVGIDYTAGGAIREDKGIEQIPVIAGLGSMISKVVPETFEVNSAPDLTTLTIYGNNLNLSDLAVQLGSVELAVTAQIKDALQCRIEEEMRNGRIASAGSYPIQVVQTLPSGKRRLSNLLTANLLPILNRANRTSSPMERASSNLNVHGHEVIQLEGFLLGTEQDDVFVALYRNGKAEQVFDELTPQSTSEPDPLQVRTVLTIPEHKAVPPGRYRVILSVNNQQARNSPEIVLEAPT